jgi:hypothetical protein
MVLRKAREWAPKLYESSWRLVEIPGHPLDGGLRKPSARKPRNINEEAAKVAAEKVAAAEKVVAAGLLGQLAARLLLLL